MIWKKPAVAAAVLIAVLLLGTLYGSHRSLAGERRDIEEMFYSGTDGSGYGIATNLDLRVEYARNLAKVASRYDVDPEREALLSAASDLETAETADRKYAADQALSGAVSDLEMAMKQENLSDEDATYLKTLTADLDSYEMRIDKLTNSYNEAVRNFNEKILGSFPSNLLGPLTGIRALEVYA